MINIIVVHITDVHIKGHSDDLLRRASSIGSVLAANFVAGRSVVLAISGDIAWSGKPAQYESAEKFISTCADAIRRAGFEYVGLVVAPGNHDCDFDLQDEHERLALWAGAQDLSNSLSLFKSLSIVQKPFEDFIYLAGVNSTSLTPLLARSEFFVAGCTINIDALNTSWGTIRDKAEGHLPFAEIDIPQCGDNIVNVLVAHHPPNWFLQEHKARFSAG